MLFCFGQHIELGMSGDNFAEYIILDDTYPRYIPGCTRGILAVAHSVYLKQICQDTVGYTWGRYLHWLDPV